MIRAFITKKITSLVSPDITVSKTIHKVLELAWMIVAKKRLYSRRCNSFKATSTRCITTRAHVPDKKAVKVARVATENTLGQNINICD